MLNQQQIDQIRRSMTTSAADFSTPLILSGDIQLAAGMSMRDILAAVVLHKLAPPHTPVVTMEEAEQIAFTAYQVSDAMLKRRHESMPEKDGSKTLTYRPEDTDEPRR